MTTMAASVSQPLISSGDVTRSLSSSPLSLLASHPDTVDSVACPVTDIFLV